MEYSRRHLFRVGQAVLAAAAFPGITLGADSGELGANLTRKRFASLIEANFRVALQSGPSRWFTLMSVEDMTSTASTRHAKGQALPAIETFALHFLSSGESMPQGTYVFEHESTGRLPLFIVPSGTSTYIAIVNRLENR